MAVLPMKKTPFQEAGGWDMDFKTNGVVDPAKVKLWTDEYAKTSGNGPAILTGSCYSTWWAIRCISTLGKQRKC